MYLYALLYLVTRLVIPLAPTLVLSSAWYCLYISTVNIIFLLIPGIFGDWLYLQHIRCSIAQNKTSKKGISKTAMFIVLGIIMIIYLLLVELVLSKYCLVNQLDNDRVGWRFNYMIIKYALYYDYTLINLRLNANLTQLK